MCHLLCQTLYLILSWVFHQLSAEYLKDLGWTVTALTICWKLQICQLLTNKNIIDIKFANAPYHYLTPVCQNFEWEMHDAKFSLTKQIRTEISEVQLKVISPKLSMITA
jgi:hypothetical protein